MDWVVTEGTTRLISTSGVVLCMGPWSALKRWHWPTETHWL